MCNRQINFSFSDEIKAVHSNIKRLAVRYSIIIH